jgi:hypothetical protein
VFEKPLDNFDFLWHSRPSSGAIRPSFVQTGGALHLNENGKTKFGKSEQETKIKCLNHTHTFVRLNITKLIYETMQIILHHV